MNIRFLTIALIALTGGILFSLLSYPSSVAGNAVEDAAQRYQDWVNGGSVDYNNSGGGNGGSTCKPDEGTTRDDPGDCNGNQQCSRDYVKGCNKDSTGNLYDCRKERGKCGYWGQCRPRYCDSGKQCSPVCVAQKENTCNPDNGLHGGCVYTSHSSGKACVKTDAPPEPCQVDACNYPSYACSSIFQRCVYTIPWLGIGGGNAHLNR